MKDCKKIHPLLPLYIEDALSTREKAAVEKHINTCPDAKTELKQLERLGKALKNIPEPKAPHDLHAKIMARVHVKPAPASKPIWFHASWGLATAAGLAMLFFIQDSSWFEHKNTPIVLKPSAPASSNAPRTEVALKPRKDSLANQQVALNTVKKEAPPAAEKAQAVPQINTDSSFTTYVTPTSEMVLAMAPKPKMRTKARAFQSQENASGASAAPATSEYKALSGNSTNTLNPSESGPSPLDSRLTVKSALGVPGLKKPSDIQTWSGSVGLISLKTSQLIIDSANFETQWNAVHPRAESLPTVDFTTQSIIFLIEGAPGSGYSLQVLQLEDQPDQLVVHYQMVAPPGPSLAQITYPWLMQVISKPTKPVVFTKDE